MWWPNPMELLISSRLKGTVLDSKSILWDETEYLPAGVTLRPCLGLQGLLWYSQTQGTRHRNVPQIWQEQTDSAMRWSACVCCKTRLFRSCCISWSLCQTSETTQTHRDVGRVEAAMLWGQLFHPFIMAPGKVAEALGMVGTMNTPTSSQSAKERGITMMRKSSLCPYTPLTLVLDYTVNM